MHCDNCGHDFDPLKTQGKCPICGMSVNLRKDTDAPTEEGTAQENKQGTDSQQTENANSQDRQEFNQDSRQANYQGCNPNFDGHCGPGRPYGPWGNARPNMGWGETGYTDYQPSGMGGQRPFQGPRPDSPEYSLYLIIGIIMTICCCNWIFGVLTIIFTVQMNSAFKLGDRVGYENYKRIIHILWIIGAIAYALSFVGFTALGILDVLTY